MSERFKVPSDAEMTPEQRVSAQAIIDSPRKGIRGPFPLLLRQPAIADATRLLGDCVRYGTSLSARVREIAILVVVRHWGVSTEWASHGKIARDAGISDAVLDALKAGKRPEAGLNASELVAHDVAKELLSGRELGEASFAAAKDAFGDTGTAELVASVAYYNFICVVMNAMAAPLAPGVERLEPFT